MRIKTLPDDRLVLAHWRERYNTAPPHKALNWQAPSAKVKLPSCDASARCATIARHFSGCENSLTTAPFSICGIIVENRD